MAVKFVEATKKAVAKKSKIEQVGEVAAIVEKMAALSIKLDALTEAEKEYNKLRGQLAGMIPAECPAEEPFVFEGVKHDVVFSERPVERKIIDMESAFDALGQELFLQVAKVTLKDVDKYMTPEEQEGIIVSARTGSRRCAVKEKE